ncbi:glycosyltransferase, partial [Escherichia coli]
NGLEQEGLPFPIRQSDALGEFIKERFSYLADNKKENAPELNVSYGIDKNFLYGAGVSISSVLINNSDINFVFHVFT